MPTSIALVLVVALATLLVLLVIAVIGGSVTQFQSQLPDYQARLDLLVSDALSWLADRGIEINTAELSSQINSGAILSLVGDTASSLLSALSNLLLVVLTMIFMLLEANTLPDKLRAAMDDPDADLSGFAQAAQLFTQLLNLVSCLFIFFHFDIHENYDIIFS